MESSFGCYSIGVKPFICFIGMECSAYSSGVSRKKNISFLFVLGLPRSSGRWYWGASVVNYQVSQASYLLIYGRTANAPEDPTGADLTGVTF